MGHDREGRTKYSIAHIEMNPVLFAAPLRSGKAGSPATLAATRTSETTRRVGETIIQKHFMNVRVTVAKPEARLCLKCGTLLQSRGEKLPGRYWCPKCPEGEADYIITREFYNDLIVSRFETNLAGRLVDLISYHSIVRVSRIVGQKAGFLVCEQCGAVIADKLAVSFCTGTALHAKSRYLHISCAQGIGLKLMEVNRT